jgi:Kef-type K+ transport system membrane component KefB
MMLAIATLLAILSKFAACALAARSLKRRGAMIVGVGMVPRGEVGIIVASLGLAARAFTHEMYAIIIAMSLLTSLFAPPALKALFAANPKPPQKPDPVSLPREPAAET